MKITITPHGNALRVSIKARAGARKNELRASADGVLKVAVTQAAEKGKANQAIIQLLSQLLRLKKSQMQLHRGHTSPQKEFLFFDVTAEDLQSRFDAVIS